MKIKYILTAFFVLLFVNLSAQTSTTLSKELNWKGIERWHAGESMYMDVLTFEGAQHTDALPFFQYSVELNGRYSVADVPFVVRIENEVFIPLEADEVEFVGDAWFDSQPILETSISTTRGNSTFHISIFPIVRQDGELLKLASFDLVLEENPVAVRGLRASPMRTYVANSVLSQGRFIKVRITESGVHRISHADLRSRGIDPANVRMFGYGGAKLSENSLDPYTSDLPEIAIFDTGSAILFFAQGVTSWSFDASPNVNMFVRTLNPYSLHGHYFITSDNIGEGRRIEMRGAVNPNGAPVHDVREFTDFQVHERELNTMIRSGRDFFGERFTNGASIQIPFSFPNLITNTPIRTQIHVVNSDATRADFRLTLDNSSSPADAFSFTNRSSIRQQNFNAPSANLNFRLQYNGTANGFLNFLTVNAQRELRMVGTNMLFHNNRNIGAGSFNRYFLETNNDNIQIWDVTNQRNIQRIPTTRQGGSLVFVDSASERKSYVAIDPNNLTNIPSAVLLDEVPRQNIHGMSPVDMLIITHPLFLAPAERLAQAHAENPDNPLRVGVVTTQQVYNEFSSGTPDATAYRWVAKMFYDRAQTDADRIRYLLLFGNGHFDNRGILPSTRSNMVLTFQSVNSWTPDASFATDDYFGLMEDGKGTNLHNIDRMDIAVGRFPAVTLADANGMVDKTIAYMRNENNGGWKNQLLFVGDDNADGWTRNLLNIHMRQANELADRVSALNPAFHTNKIMLDAFQPTINASGRRYHDANIRFQNLLRSGVLFVAYMGHGNPSSWGGSQIFTTREANELRNRNLPLFIAGTCDWSRFDGDVISGGEEVVRNPLGGGIGSLSASRVVFSTPNETLMRNVVDNLFQPRDEPISIGEAIRRAKNVPATDGINRLKFIYFGDPSIRLQKPNRHRIEVTEINGNASDTVRAMSSNTVRGIVVNRAGAKQSHFNGTVSIVVFDKEETITALLNDDNSTDGHPHLPFQFQDRPNTLFRGSAEVVNGEFEFSFIVPRSIRFNYGSGRMIFNAWSSEDNFEEAQGYFEDFIVGGSEDIPRTTESPTVRMYLNHPGFVSGGRVNETPIFKAHIFSNYGINISSPDPGHDMLLMVGNRSFVLNNYFEARLGTYKEGTVNFQLPELAEGRHSLRFRVWNMHGNSTVEYLDFEVVRDLQPEIFSVTAFPNPATTEVNFKVTHDRADEIISMRVDVFDLTGRQIWSRTQEDTPVINWNIERDTGGRINPGIYIYRISTMNGRRISSSASGRIVIK